MGKTMLYASEQPGGMFTVTDASEGAGSVFFVNSTGGVNAAGNGYNPDIPLATLDYAVGVCTSGKGDRIILMPGHAETLTTATSCVLDVSGVQVIGVGVGALQPTFTMGTIIGTTISVTAPNCRIKNVKLVSALEDLTAGVTVGALADGLILEDCWLTDGSVILEMVIGVSVAAACDNVTIRRNRFITVPAGGCASAISFLGATSFSRVNDNYISGDYSVAAIDGATAAGFHVEIARNKITNIDTTAGLIISLHAGTTGMVCDNRSFGGKNNVHHAVAGCMVAENYSSNAMGASGLIIPAVDA